MITKERSNAQIINTTFAPAVEDNSLELWVVKDKNTVRDLFQIIHKYEHYYLLQNSKGIKVCAKFQEVKSNSEDEPMFFF